MRICYANNLRLLTRGERLYWEMLVMFISCMAHRMTLYFTTQHDTTLYSHAVAVFYLYNLSLIPLFIISTVIIIMQHYMCVVGLQQQCDTEYFLGACIIQSPCHIEGYIRVSVFYILKLKQLFVKKKQAGKKFSSNMHKILSAVGKDLDSPEVEMKMILWNCITATVRVDVELQQSDAADTACKLGLKWK